MTKVEETNLMLDSINESLKKGEVSDYGQLMSAALLDVAKSLAVIADGILIQSEQMVTQNKQLEKIEDDFKQIRT